MSAWLKKPSIVHVISVENKLRAFVRYALEQLEAAQPALEDGEGDDYAELCGFCRGFARGLRATGAKASPALRGAITAKLARVWDVNAEAPGPDLASGGVAALAACLEDLSTTCFGAEPPAARPPKAGLDVAAMDLTEAANHLWAEDRRARLKWGPQGFTLDLQHHGHRDDGVDPCPGPLFATVDRGHPFWKAKPTAAFVALLDNYEREVGHAEKTTARERAEVDAFLDACVATPHFLFLRAFLVENGVDPRTKRLRTALDLKHLLWDLWFAPSRRPGAPRRRARRRDAPARVGTAASGGTTVRASSTSSSARRAGAPSRASTTGSSSIWRR